MSQAAKAAAGVVHWRTLPRGVTLPLSNAHPAECWDTALARARQSADDSLRGRIDAFLNLPGPLATRGKLPRGRYCSDCRLTARYPDNRCPAHTAYLTGTDAERRAYDSDDALWLSLWRRWWEQVRALLGPT